MCFQATVCTCVCLRVHMSSGSVTVWKDVKGGVFVYILLLTLANAEQNVHYPKKKTIKMETRTFLSQIEKQ